MRKILQAKTMNELTQLYRQITLGRDTAFRPAIKAQAVQAILELVKKDIVAGAQLHILLGLVDGDVSALSDIEFREPTTLEQVFREIAEKEMKTYVPNPEAKNKTLKPTKVTYYKHLKVRMEKYRAQGRISEWDQ